MKGDDLVIVGDDLEKLDKRICSGAPWLEHRGHTNIMACVGRVFVVKDIINGGLPWNVFFFLHDKLREISLHYKIFNF